VEQGIREALLHACVTALPCKEKRLSPIRRTAQACNPVHALQLRAAMGRFYELECYFAMAVRANELPMAIGWRAQRTEAFNGASGRKVHSIDSQNVNRSIPLLN